MIKIHLKISFVFACLFSVSNCVFSQSAMSGLAGGLGGAAPQVTVINKKVDDVSVKVPFNINEASMTDFLALEKKCKSGDGDSCLYAGKIMMLEKPPQEIFSLSSSTRANRGIRLYEASISANENLEAMELVYDLYYDKNLINRQLNSYTDKDRARELLEQMISKNYPGGLIRQAREYIEDPEYLLSLSKKKEACSTARALAEKRNLSSSTKSIVDEMLNGNICAVYNK